MTKTKQGLIRKEICDMVDGYKAELQRRDTAVAKLQKKITAENKESEELKAVIDKQFALLNVAAGTEEVFHGKTQKMQIGKGAMVTVLASPKRLYNAMAKVNKEWTYMKYNVGDVKKSLTEDEYKKVSTISRDGTKRKITFPK